MLLPALRPLLRLIAKMLLLSTTTTTTTLLFHLATVLARPTELSLPKETSVDPRHAVLEKRYNTCGDNEEFLGSYCFTVNIIVTRCRMNTGAGKEATFERCPSGTFCHPRFFENPDQAICLSVIKAVHWASRVGDSCQGVNSGSNVGQKVRMLVDVFQHGAVHAPNHLSLYAAGHQLIEEAVPDQGGTFISKPFTLLGGVLTCVYSATAGLDIFAFIRPA